MMVSIIIPFHKGTAFLNDALQSLKDQLYKDIEIILVCDHIEENLKPILSLYQEELDIKVYDLQKKSGVAAARNLGLSIASGEYIYFLDSDDYLNYNTLDILVTAAEQENTDISYGKITKTWFKRSTFQLSMEQKDADMEEETDEDSNPSVAGTMVSTDSITELMELIKEDTQTEESDMQNNILQDNRVQAYKHLISKRKGLKTVSILNILIKRTLITENELQFNEKLIYFSDYPFLFQILHHATSFSYQKDAVYVKRNHNDPINFPSLSQLYGSKDLKEYILAYQYTAALRETDSDLRRLLDRKLLHYYATGFAPRLYRSSDTAVLNSQFQEMHLLIQNIEQELINHYHGYKRRLLKLLKSGDFKKSVSTVTIHLARKKIKKIIKNKKELAKTLYKYVFIKKSVKENWVLCESFFGKYYSDNPKYIYEYLSCKYPDQYKFIWVMDKVHTKIPYKHTKVKRFSIRYYYYLARCKYFVFNGRQPEWTLKRKENIFLQTWHGTPLKHLAFDQEEVTSATAQYKKQIYNQSRAWDYLVAPNQFSSDIFKRCFLFNKVMLETGYPRNDILHSQDKDQISARIKRKLRLPLDKKIILYAPTWRDDEYYAKGKYKFSLQLDLRLLKENLSKDYIVLLRTHYFIADNLDLNGLEDFAYNLSNYDDIGELYLISDVLITDYSSVFFDYANLRRPIIFYMYDLEKYRDVLRGFYIDIEEELPGPLLLTSEAVLDTIKNIEEMEQKYIDKYNLFYHKYCSWEDGSSSEKVVNKVFTLLK